MKNLHRILAEEGLQAPRVGSLNSLSDDERKVKKAIQEGDAMTALHHLGVILSEVAWAIRELDDPMAEKVMDVARDFSRLHR